MQKTFSECRKEFYLTNNYILQQLIFHGKICAPGCRQYGKVFLNAERNFTNYYILEQLIFHGKVVPWGLLLYEKNQIFVWGTFGQINLTQEEGSTKPRRRNHLRARKSPTCRNHCDDVERRRSSQPRAPSPDSSRSTM